VNVGSNPCPWFRWIDESTLEVEVPAGIGTDVPVVVSRRDNVTSLPALFSYAKPEVTSSQPAFLLPGIGNASVQIHGTNFGSSDADVAQVKIGPYQCLPFHVVNSSLIECQLMEIQAWPSSRIGIMPTGEVESVFDGAFEGFEAPSIASINPSSGPTNGGSRCNITGDFFADESVGGVVSVLIGGRPCDDVQVLSRTMIQATTPAGTGANKPIVVMSATGVSSAPMKLWNYVRPYVETVDPLRVFVGESNIAVTLWGQDFGSDGSVPDSVSLEASSPGGGVQMVPCQSPVVSSRGTVIRCTVQSLGAEMVAGGTYSYQVIVGGQASTSSVQSGYVEVIGAPSVSYADPGIGHADGTVDDAGSRTVTVHGSGFGYKLDDIARVMVGNRAVEGTHPGDRGFTYISSTELQISLPPGSGKKLSVTVTTRGGLSNGLNEAFSYLPPSVSAINPSYSFVGNFVADFNINGTEFGLPSSLVIPSVSVGGQPCGSVVLKSTTELQCNGLNASGLHTSEVIVAVDGQRSATNSMFESVADPVVATVGPNIAGPGEEILIFGENFGYAAADLRNVYVDGIPCSSFAWQGPTAVTCNVPPAGEARLALAEFDTRALMGLSIVVETFGRQFNPSNALFAYTGSGDNPFNAPFNVMGHREIGQSASVMLRWLYTDEDLTG